MHEEVILPEKIHIGNYNVPSTIHHSNKEGNNNDSRTLRSDLVIQLAHQGSNPS